MPHTGNNSFYPKPSSISNKLLFDFDSTFIIIQPESEKQILNKKLYNRSDFKMKKLQRVRFWIEKNTTR